MRTATSAIARARSQVGYSRWDDPKPGTVYGRWYAKLKGIPYYGTSGVPYCAMFASWVLDQDGVRSSATPEAYCPYMVSKAKAAGEWVSRDTLAPGDLVLFDWTGDGLADHVGIVASVEPWGVRTVEGNTSPGTAGSQGNGGGVWERSRELRYVMGGVRPRYDSEEAEVITDQDVQRIAKACAEYTFSEPHIKRGFNMYNSTHWTHELASEILALLRKVAAKLGVK